MNEEREKREREGERETKNGKRGRLKNEGVA